MAVCIVREYSLTKKRLRLKRGIYPAHHCLKVREYSLTKKRLRRKKSRPRVWMASSCPGVFADEEAIETLAEPLEAFPQVGVREYSLTKKRLRHS